jgi:multicomponent Na+:H+ antiporter subunit F
MGMNIWLWAALVLMVCLIPCGIACLRGDIWRRLVGLEAAGMIASLILLLLAEGFHRAPFADLALALALLSFGGGLVFVRFLERWM